MIAPNPFPTVMNMTQTREIVVPGDVVGKAAKVRPGTNTYQVGDDIVAGRLGVKSVRGDRINVIGLSGRYEPMRGDVVIGTVAEAGPSNWYLDIGSANDVGMHVNDVPWRVDFGETTKYLAVGDAVLLKVVHVDELKKAQVSMKDRACKKLSGGLIYDIAPTKVPRVVGRGGSMIALLKDETNVRIFVGQNGKVWLDGESEDVALALEGLQKIEAEAHTTGLTDRMKAWLKARKAEGPKAATRTLTRADGLRDADGLTTRKFATPERAAGKGASREGAGRKGAGRKGASKPGQAKQSAGDKAAATDGATKPAGKKAGPKKAATKTAAPAKKAASKKAATAKKASKKSATKKAAAPKAATRKPTTNKASKKAAKKASKKSAKKATKKAAKKGAQ